MGLQETRESRNSCAEETKSVWGGSAIVSREARRETEFGTPNCHLSNFPMSPVSPYSLGSCQFKFSMGRFVISKWVTAPGLCIN